ncbi:sulfotransferase 1B1-like [Mercenaria mercenaria]|uniref:sulfotransferase 1B1-like n=1 Tax=Mercenaria mercenaria TaxID=6596 RepID=UPI00234E64B4|nr:sulfotransferase 1B1-like [Mercenaria mercenaria]
MMYAEKTETIPISKIEHMIEAVPWETVESLPSPRILNTHLHYSRLPKQAKEKSCKMVYVIRNPKDVAVSLYHHTVGIDLFEYKGKWEHFLPLFTHGKKKSTIRSTNELIKRLIGVQETCSSCSKPNISNRGGNQFQPNTICWFEYVLEWEDIMARNPELPIHLIYYEDLKENTLQELYRLGKFLGVENKDGIFEEISEKCQFDNMVKDKQQYLAPNVAFLADGFTFYRKGDIGDWKNWFTVAQNEMFDEIYSKKNNNSKHKFRYSKK